MRNTLKTHQVCTIVLPTKAGQTLRIRKAATPDHDVADLYRLLRLPRHIITPTSTWTDSPPSD